MSAAQVRLDMHEQLTRVEGLGHIVVPTSGEPNALVNDIAFCGKKNHRNRYAPGAQFATRSEPIHPRHHDVENHEVERCVLECLKSIGAVFDTDAFMTLIFKQSTYKLLDAHLIISKQNLHRNLPPHPAREHRGCAHRTCCRPFVAIRRSPRRHATP